MRRRERQLERPDIPPELSYEGFMGMSQWVINTCGVVYQDVSDIRHFAWYEGASKAPFWLAVTGVAGFPKQKKNKFIPAKIGVRNFEAYIREDGSEFRVTASSDFTDKERLALVDDPYNADGYSIMRAYCLDVHEPVPAPDRELRRIEFDTLRNSGPLDL